MSGTDAGQPGGARGTVYHRVASFEPRIRRKDPVPAPQNHPADPTALLSLGYTERWQALFQEHAKASHSPGRVIRTDRGAVLVATDAGSVPAEPSPRLRRAAGGPEDLPATGDWVALDPAPVHDIALVEAVLPRASAFLRGDASGRTQVQVLAANVDTVFVVHPAESEPNLRRVERELALSWDSGAVPVVVLSKADLYPRAESAREAVETVALGVDVHLTSAVSGLGIAALRTYTQGHRTVALIGPSGVGKSSIVNALLGAERQDTRAVRVTDGKGRHTTVARELIPLPTGGVLIDTPGLRALALTDASEGIAAAFPDIETLAPHCRFRDCTHRGEPGCAVRSAVERGALPPERLASYHKLMEESAWMASRTDARLRSERNRSARALHREIRRFYKQRGR
jgi:ribosome biogenesis GTPase